MSLSSLAAAVFGSNPIYLYEFTRGGTSWLRATSAFDVVRVVNSVSKTFLSSSLKHDRIVDSNFSYRSELKIELPLSDSLAAHTLITGFVESVKVSIWRTESSLTDVIPVFKGEVYSKAPDDAKGILRLDCLTEVSSLARKGLVGVFHRPCRHTHFGRGCRLNPALFEVSATIAAIAADGVSLTLTFPGTPPEAGDCVFGILTRTTDNQTRLIRSNSGNSFLILSPIPNLAESDSVTVTPGCNLSRERCHERFDNMNNFGGFPFISDNPFDGRQVF